jgi:hypothetical protein
MSNQSARLQSYGFSHTAHRVATTAPLSTTRNHRRCIHRGRFLSTYGFTISTISDKEEFGIFFDAADNMEDFIDISEICEMEPNPDGTESDTIKQPYSMRYIWRAKIAQRVLDDTLTGHPMFPKIEALLITDGDFLITFRNPDGTDGNCGNPNTFRLKMKNVIKTNNMFRIAITLQSADVASLGVRPQDYLDTALQLLLTGISFLFLLRRHRPQHPLEWTLMQSWILGTLTISLSQPSPIHNIFNIGITFYTPVDAFADSTQYIGGHSSRHLTWALHGHLLLWIKS